MLGLALCLLVFRAAAAEDDARRTPLVRAVQRAQPSVVNIFGEKRVISGDFAGQAVDDRRVNGMGTGVVLDQRGYVLTNYHVIEGVDKIQVTLSDGQTTSARLIGYDADTDLAVVKVDVEDPLPVIAVGRSDDLMPGESVIAIGNAFGYGHTVTRGIISALNRTVQVTDVQRYENLIQTDASINPGNSGGPLLNIHGEMIGVNVAVRAGAQGIGFAIPSDRAMEVAAELMSARRLNNLWHGLVLKDEVYDGAVAVQVVRVDEGSPAAKAGLMPGDRLLRIEQTDIRRALDVERALLDAQPGQPLQFAVRRGGQPLETELALVEARGAEPVVADRAWQVLGLKLRPATAAEQAALGGRYRGGLLVTAVRAGSPADAQGIRRGDILVGMHIWETATLENVQFVLKRIEPYKLDPLKFYIVRGSETLYGYLPVAVRR